MRVAGALEVQVPSACSLVVGLWNVCHARRAGYRRAAVPHFGAGRAPGHRRYGGLSRVRPGGQIVPVPFLLQQPCRKDGVPWSVKGSGDGNALGNTGEVKVLGADAGEDVTPAVVSQEVRRSQRELGGR